MQGAFHRVSRVFSGNPGTLQGYNRGLRRDVLVISKGFRSALGDSRNFDWCSRRPHEVLTGVRYVPEDFKGFQ